MYTPSPQRGEGWGEGDVTCTFNYYTLTIIKKSKIYTRGRLQSNFCVRNGMCPRIFATTTEKEFKTLTFLCRR
jgi:hypothetical protein